MFTRFAAALLGAASLSALSFAQERPVGAEEVIVTGSKGSGGTFGAKSGIPLDKLPQSVQVLTAGDLKDRAIVDMGQALRAVPSANAGRSRVSAYQSFSLRVRGFLADQMRNGVRQRYYEDVDASSMSNIERIEVLKGPSAVLFGHSALGGIVSIITKKPLETFSANISATYGTFGRKSLSVDIGGPLTADGRLAYRLTGEIERSGTYVDFQDIDRENLGFALAWSPSDVVSAHLVLEWQERRSLRHPGLPVVGTVLPNGAAPVRREAFLAEPAAGDLEAFAPLVQAWADIRLSENWTLTPRVSWSGFDTNFTQIRVLGIRPDQVSVNRNGRFGKEEDSYTIYQLDLRGSFKAGSMLHNVLLGAEYGRERSTFLEETLTGIGPISTIAPVYQFSATVRPGRLFSFYSEGDVDTKALYLQDVVDLTPAWNLVGAIRYTEVEVDRLRNGAVSGADTSNVSWQIGSTLKLGGGWSLYGGFNTGFDLEGSAGARAVDGSPFEPEEANQFEGGIRFLGETVSASLSAFRIKRVNLLTADPLNPGFSVQIGEVEVKGIELEGRWDLTPDLRLQGGYAYLDSEIVRSNAGDQGAELGDTPRHTATLHASWTIPGTGWEVNGGVNFVGERRLVTNSAVILPSYTIADLGIAYSFGKTRVALSASNLFDVRYFVAGGNAFTVFAGDPRQISLTLSQDF